MHQSYENQVLITYTLSVWTPVIILTVRSAKNSEQAEVSKQLECFSFHDQVLRTHCFFSSLSTNDYISSHSMLNVPIYINS